MVIFVTLVVQGLSLPLLLRWLKIKSQDNTDAEVKELQLHLATSTIHFIEQDLPIQLDGSLQEKLKGKYEELIQGLSREIRRQKKGKVAGDKAAAIASDNLLNAQFEVCKFRRALLLKLHKEGDYSDAVIRQLEREMDIDELKLSQAVPKTE